MIPWWAAFLIALVGGVAGAGVVFVLLLAAGVALKSRLKGGRA